MSGFEWLFGAGASTGAGAGAGASAAGTFTVGSGAAATYGGLTVGEWAALGSTAISTASQVQGAAAQGAQASELGKAALSQARQEEFIDRKKSASLIAKQKAIMATAGLDIGSGTPNELLLDSAYNAELNALNIRKQGRFNSDYYKTMARRSKAQIPGMIFGGLLKGYGDYGGGDEYSKLLKKLKTP